METLGFDESQRQRLQAALLASAEQVAAEERAKQHRKATDPNYVSDEDEDFDMPDDWDISAHTPKDMPPLLWTGDEKVDINALEAVRSCMGDEDESPYDVALRSRDRGNIGLKTAMKAGCRSTQMRNVIAIYTEGIAANVSATDPELYSALLANRALAHLKIKNYYNCVVDCAECIKWDPCNLKVYWRAATASSNRKPPRWGEALDWCDRGIAIASSKSSTTPSLLSNTTPTTSSTSTPTTNVSSALNELITLRSSLQTSLLKEYEKNELLGKEKKMKLEKAKKYDEDIASALKLRDIRIEKKKEKKSWRDKEESRKQGNVVVSTIPKLDYETNLLSWSVLLIIEEYEMIECVEDWNEAISPLELLHPYYSTANLPWDLQHQYFLENLNLFYHATYEKRHYWAPVDLSQPLGYMLSRPDFVIYSTVEFYVIPKNSQFSTLFLSTTPLTLEEKLAKRRD